MTLLRAGFRLQIRRNEEADRPFGVRYEAQQGRGTLVLPTSGVTAAPPASKQDEIQNLSLDELRGGRFLHIPGAAKHRITYPFESLSTAELRALPANRWLSLEPVSDPTGPRLRLGMVAPEIALDPSPTRAVRWSPAPDGSPRLDAPPDLGDAPVPMSSGSAVRESTAAERIAELEAQVDLGRLRLSSLTRRIAELERQVESLGGEVGPWEIDTRNENTEG